MSYSAQHLNETNTRANKLALLCAHEVLDLSYERPLPRVVSIETAPLLMPVYPGAIARSGYGDITLMPVLTHTRMRNGRLVVGVSTTH